MKTTPFHQENKIPSPITKSSQKASSEARFYVTFISIATIAAILSLILIKTLVNIGLK